MLVDGNQPKGSDLVRLYSDLKRHAMGPGLADPHDHPSGIPKDVFLTRPLWGLADTAPYMHDGSLATLEDVVQFYVDGGRANSHLDEKMQPLELTDTERKNLIAFLEALSRQG